MALLAPLLPYLLLLIGAVATYFGIKRKGKLEERAKQEAAKQEVVTEVQHAVSSDAAVDAKVEAKREESKKRNAVPSDGTDVFKF